MEHMIIQITENDAVPLLAPETFWSTFQHGTALVNGVRLHYVEGGQGSPILLLPGWPQSWYTWRYVMPQLVQAGHRVIALDPRGLGDSERPTSGYDMQTVASDVHGFVEALGLLADGPIDVVGHDIGAWIGYAYAAGWSAAVKRLAVFDSALPGVTPLLANGIPSEEANMKTWHFAFNRLPDLPEILLQGREREFLTWLFHAKSVHSWAIGAADLDEYVRVNSAPGALRAALSYYRHQFSQQGLAESRQRAERKLGIPVLAFGAQQGVGTMLIETMKLVADDVRGGVLNACGHYMPEEAPRTVARLIIEFMNS
jgi:pimeloyl-ACP methyl ester carboxylesterase